MLHKLKFYCSIATLYCLTIGTIGTMLYSSQLFSAQVRAEPQKLTTHPSTVHRSIQVISGEPVRISIPTSGIDLWVDPGHYDPGTKSWTLSPEHAQFAVMTTRPNNYAGTTFIYGHGTDAVFGKIGTKHPPIGTQAFVYTDNGHVFTYELETIQDLKPSDTSILQNTATGSPRLIVQTCTGVFSEWRTMFTFLFRKVS